MKLHLRLAIAAALAVVAPAALTAPAAAQEFPLAPGEYSSMSGIFVEDGGSFAYAQFLATQWQQEQEFSKSKGWITGYKIYINVDARDGEPNVYLVTTYRDIPDAAEIERRNKEYAAWSAKTDQQLDAESGNRVTIRKQRGTMLLQEYTIRK